MHQAVLEARSQIELRRPGTLRPAADPEAELVAAAAAGNQEAFASLVDRHKSSLVNYLSKLVRCRDRAEDLAQETFVRFFQSLGRYQHRGQLAAFLFRIGTNLVRSEERRAKRWRVIRGALTVEEPEPPPSPARSALSSEATIEVQRAIRRLPMRFRAPLVLREIEGWSYEQISEVLGCKNGTVKSRIHRAKAQLRTDLDHYWKH